MDDWARDPGVQIMRRVFRQMEKAQAEFLRDVGVSPWDERLRVWREKARVLLEKTWSKATESGVGLDEKFLADLYLRCLAWAMGCEDFKASSRALPMKEKIDRLIKESLQ